MTPDFEPSSQTLISKSVKDLSYKDSSIPYERTFYYIVRSEDSTKSNDGPNGGNEDKNLKFINLTPEGKSEEIGSIKDDGGDTFAFANWKSLSQFQGFKTTLRVETIVIHFQKMVKTILQTPVPL